MRNTYWLFKYNLNWFHTFRAISYRRLNIALFKKVSHIAFFLKMSHPKIAHFLLLKPHAVSYMAKPNYITLCPHQKLPRLGSTAPVAPASSLDYWKDWPSSESPYSQSSELSLQMPAVARPLRAAHCLPPRLYCPSPKSPNPWCPRSHLSSTSTTCTRKWTLSISHSRSKTN